MNCCSQQELQASRGKWEEQVLNGKGTKIHGMTRNGPAIIYYVRVRQTMLLLTGASDITAISCNYFKMMATERLITWGMAYRSTNLTRDT